MINKHERLIELRGIQAEMARCGRPASYGVSTVIKRIEKEIEMDQDNLGSTNKTPLNGGPLQGNLSKRTKHEGVGTQAHYNNFEIEPIDYIVKNNLSFLEGNVIKYVTRHKLKNGLEDLKKAQQYLAWLIEEHTDQFYATREPTDAEHSPLTAEEVAKINNINGLQRSPLDEHMANKEAAEAVVTNG